MSPEVTAAIIAGSVGVLTVIATRGCAVSSAAAQRKAALNSRSRRPRRTLLTRRWSASEQLDRTLAEQRTRTLNERFATAAEQLGSDKPAVRLAGVYAMAGLADDWEENRQTCVDVLCAYLRMPYEPDPGQDAPEPQRLAFQAIREVRHTVIRVITAHLKEDAAVSWQGLNFDFTGVVFDGGDFSGARFSGGKVDFTGAQFSGGSVNFNIAQFSGGTSTSATPSSPAGRSASAAPSSAAACQLRRRQVLRRRGRLRQFGSPAARSTSTTPSSPAARSASATPSSPAARSTSTAPSSPAARSTSAGAMFSGGEVRFGDCRQCRFPGAARGRTSARAQFSGGTVDFSGSTFSGGTVDFRRAEFSGGTVDFSGARDWSVPPAFPWTDTPPSGVKLPRKGINPRH